MADRKRLFDMNPLDRAVLLVWIGGELAFLLALAHIVWAQSHVQPYADAVRAYEHGPMLTGISGAWTLLGSLWLLHSNRTNHKSGSSNHSEASSR